MLNVLAVYDICRSDLAKFKGLSRGEEDRPLDTGNCINYQSICGTDPRGTVPAASKLAVLLFKECDKAAAQNPQSMIQIPIAWIAFQGENGMVEKGMMGEIYWMGWKQKPGQVQSSKPLPDTQEEEKKQPPAQAYVPPVPKAAVVLPPKPLSVLNPQKKWTPKFCQPISFGKQREKLAGKFPNLEELHRLKKPPKLTAIQYKVQL